MELLDDYMKRKADIQDRLEYFREVWKGSENEVFSELCFCLCTPQSKARTCDAFIQKVKKNGLLYTGTSEELLKHMKGVRFSNNKSKRIVEARNFFTAGGSIEFKKYIDTKNPSVARDWLVKNIKGLGMKESSHFLRNVGMGRNLAILDRHILKNLVKHGVINEVPGCLTRKRYLDIEERMREFSGKTGIPMDEMDILFWSRETGEIFK